ncbi:MAG: hypothetical protein A2583_09575 [Bdellovibrionales bacterium RIFOXYD1_FULL_53_11]|nr:MAG: hypothetical protein A2583_09575 [Bdellovibrionales bacterium RIFOXYD1_FULL_53_11]
MSMKSRIIFACLALATLALFLPAKKTMADEQEQVVAYALSDAFPGKKTFFSIETTPSGDLRGLKYKNEFNRTIPYTLARVNSKAGAKTTKARDKSGRFTIPVVGIFGKNVDPQRGGKLVMRYLANGLQLTPGKPDPQMRSRAYAEKILTIRKSGTGRWILHVVENGIERPFSMMYFKARKAFGMPIGIEEVHFG